MEKPKLSYVEGLRESTLGPILKDLFPEGEWLHNKYLRISKEDQAFYNLDRIFPDYRNEHYKLIVEFDGDGGVRRGHYSDASTCMRDLNKVMLLESLGYKVVSIPPFVQLDKVAIKYYFGIDTDKEYYPTCHEHGFDYYNITLPSNYCSLGMRRFYDEFRNLPLLIRYKIRDSLANRFNYLLLKGHPESEAELLVIPKELLCIMEYGFDERQEELLRSINEKAANK